jgi:hypothetical protein
MMSFSLSGGVEVLGFISPTEITDEYPVIDPLYGIDGFRNVNTLDQLNTISSLRRRAGMVVGVSGGTMYYKLKPSPWNKTISDWELLDFSNTAFTGGTVTGPTTFTNGLSANTFSAGTYQNLPISGLTAGNNINISGSNGNFTISVTGITDTVFTGGTGSCITDLYIENLHSCTTDVKLHNDITPNTDNTINLGTSFKRFRDINTVSGTTSYWKATVKIVSPELDLGNDSLGNPRTITADSSIIQNDTLLGGTY